MHKIKMLQSTARFYSLLDRPRVARWSVVALLAIHTGLLAYSAYVHSPTLNEPGHLTAGLSHWKFGRFELYRVNPPLVRMVAALPPMAAGIETDWSGFYEGPGARPVFSMGEDLIAANGERSFDLFMIARWACIPFSWIGAIVCFLWARDLYGPKAGLLATTLWCFSPNILAHASLITADAPATALGLAACYTFWRWLRQPTWKLTLLTGLVLGVSELTKSTLVIIYPLWPVMWILYRLPDRAKMAVRDWLREGIMLVARIAVCSSSSALRPVSASICDMCCLVFRLSSFGLAAWGKINLTHFFDLIESGQAFRKSVGRQASRRPANRWANKRREAARAWENATKFGLSAQSPRHGGCWRNPGLVSWQQPLDLSA